MKVNVCLANTNLNQYAVCEKCNILTQMGEEIAHFYLALRDNFITLAMFPVKVSVFVSSPHRTAKGRETVISRPS